MRPTRDGPTRSAALHGRDLRYQRGIRLASPAAMGGRGELALRERGLCSAYGGFGQAVAAEIRLLIAKPSSFPGGTKKGSGSLANAPVLPSCAASRRQSR